jgi:hypothetical protein
MTLADGIYLVRQKHLEERDGRTAGPITDKYQQALANYPATMAIAHHLFALEAHKTTAYSA